MACSYGCSKNCTVDNPVTVTQGKWYNGSKFAIEFHSSDERSKNNYCVPINGQIKIEKLVKRVQQEGEILVCGACWQAKKKMVEEDCSVGT